MVETTFIDLPRGGGNLPGYWLDSTHYLIPETGDQGPLLLEPGKPPILVATDLFQRPLKAGSGPYNFWNARSGVKDDPPAFHLMLAGPIDSAASGPLQIYHSDTGLVETLSSTVSSASFSNDGHWLLATTGTGQSLIRAIDPTGAPFQAFSGHAGLWSPDGSKVIEMSEKADQQSGISFYTSPEGVFLKKGLAPGYELFPNWSPDGKFLAIWARLYDDPYQSALFAVQVP